MDVDNAQVAMRVRARGVTGALDADSRGVSVWFYAEHERREIMATSHVDAAAGEPWRVTLVGCVEQAARDMAAAVWRLRHCGNRQSEAALLVGLGDAVYALKSGGLSVAQLVVAHQRGPHEGGDDCG